MLLSYNPSRLPKRILFRLIPAGSRMGLPDWSVFRGSLCRPIVPRTSLRAPRLAMRSVASWFCATTEPAGSVYGSH